MPAAAPGHHAPVPEPAASPPAQLHLLPGALLVIILVRIGSAMPALVVRPGLLLEGLCTARDLLGFSELQRDEPRLDELLPWAGNV